MRIYLPCKVLWRFHWIPSEQRHRRRRRRHKVLLPLRTTWEEKPKKEKVYVYPSSVNHYHISNTYTEIEPLQVSSRCTPSWVLDSGVYSFQGLQKRNGLLSVDTWDVNNVSPPVRGWDRRKMWLTLVAAARRTRPSATVDVIESSYCERTVTY